MLRLFENVEDYKRYFDDLQEMFMRLATSLRRYIGR